MPDEPQSPQELLREGTGVQCETEEGSPFHAELLQVEAAESLTLRVLATGRREQLEVGRSLLLLVSGEFQRWQLQARVTGCAEQQGLRVTTSWPAEARRVERAREPRVDATLAVRVALGNEPDRPEVFTYTLNVSASGVCLAYPEALPIGQPLQMRMRLGETTHGVEGYVAWTRPLHPDQEAVEHHMVGVALQVSPLVRFELARLVARQRAAAKSIFRRGARV